MSETQHSSTAAREAQTLVTEAAANEMVVQVSARVFGSETSTVAYLPYPSIVAGETLWVEHVEPVEECRIVERNTVLNAVRMGADATLVSEDESVFAGGADV
jgi:hypothetical protein